MDHQLHLLDSFDTVGSDGEHHKVKVYERLVGDPSLPNDGREHWEPTGVLEYRLDDGRPLAATDDDHWQVARGTLTLRRSESMNERPGAAATATAASAGTATAA